MKHPSESLLSSAGYGLVPWAAPIAGRSRLIANPGCYATSVLMALLPLLKERLIEPETLVIDAKSGASGAGRKAAENLLFTEVDGECLPYKVGKHQHLPEIRRFAREFAGVEIDPMFVTHLLPVRRGIISGLYARLVSGVTQADVTAAFERAYSSYPLVRFGAAESLSLKRVVGSARTHIGFTVRGSQLYCFSLIDNLMKGAASQAVENFNRLFDLPAETALLDREGLL
jgi:N-acetyl-gamma-glutamyl-phosphate reductase